MENGNRDFNQAWNSLTTSGEMSGEPPRPFTPVGLRKDVREAGPLYHGTRADLRPGDLLTPGHASNYGSRQTANFVYLTARKEGTALAAELAAGEGLARVYVVEPLGPIEDDPNVTDRKFPGNPTRSYRTRQPLRVVREERDWTPLPPQALEAIRERMRQAARGDRGHQRIGPLTLLSKRATFIKLSGRPGDRVACHEESPSITGQGAG